MAVRKETIKQQFAQTVRQHLEPGEQVVVGAWTIQGASPWLVTGLFGLLGMLFTDAHYYFVWVTDRRVIFHLGSFWTARPTRFAWSDLRSAVRISEPSPAATWSWFRYQRPAGGAPIRLNFARPWREEFAQMVSALSTDATGQAAAVAGLPPAP